MNQPVAAPVSSNERIQVVDILRGYALFGILIVNMQLFSHPVQEAVLPAATGTAPLDQAGSFFIRFLAESKFYTLFSALFGLGFFLLTERLSARGLPAGRIYLRRLLVLLVIGIAHALLLWVGDILVVYAMGGLLLWFFRRARPRTLLIWAAVLVALPLLFYMASTGLLEMARRAGPESAATVEAALKGTIDAAQRGPTPLMRLTPRLPMSPSPSNAGATGAASWH